MNSLQTWWKKRFQVVSVNVWLSVEHWYRNLMYSFWMNHYHDDYNPLHDKDAKKFCAPGDLLFSLVLDRYGISERMEFTFAGMVDENVIT